MKALTISQPYASLIANGEKFVENRTWPTRHRGMIAIHAGLGSQYLTKRELAEYPTGCIVAIADLTGCVRYDQIEVMANSSSLKDRIKGTAYSWQKTYDHEHTEGPWCWIIENVLQVEPYMVKGKQGLWDFDGQLVFRKPNANVGESESNGL